MIGLSGALMLSGCGDKEEPQAEPTAPAAEDLPEGEPSPESYEWMPWPEDTVFPEPDFSAVTSFYVSRTCEKDTAEEVSTKMIGFHYSKDDPQKLEDYLQQTAAVLGTDVNAYAGDGGVVENGSPLKLAWTTQDDYFNITIWNAPVVTEQSPSIQGDSLALPISAPQLSLLDCTAIENQNADPAPSKISHSWDFLISGDEASEGALSHWLERSDWELPEWVEKENPGAQKGDLNLPHGSRSYLLTVHEQEIQGFSIDPLYLSVTELGLE